MIVRGESLTIIKTMLGQFITWTEDRYYLTEGETTKVKGVIDYEGVKGWLDTSMLTEEEFIIVKEDDTHPAESWAYSGPSKVVDFATKINEFESYTDYKNYFLNLDARSLVVTKYAFGWYRLWGNYGSDWQTPNSGQFSFDNDNNITLSITPLVDGVVEGDEEAVLIVGDIDDDWSRVDLVISDAVINSGSALFQISGTAYGGNTIAAHKVIDDPDGNGEFTHQWQSSADGNNWSDISSGNSLELTYSLADQKVRLETSYTDGKGFDEVVTSAYVDVIGTTPPEPPTQPEPPTPPTPPAPPTTVQPVENPTTNGNGNTEVSGNENTTTVDNTTDTNTTNTTTNNSSIVNNTSTVDNSVTNITNNTTDSSQVTTTTDSGNTTSTNTITTGDINDSFSAYPLNKVAVDLKDALSGSSRRSDFIDGTGRDDVISFGVGRDKHAGGYGADQFVLVEKDRFGKRGADTVLDFDGLEGDQLIFGREALKGLNQRSELTVAESKKELNQLKGEDAELIYLMPKGQVFFDENEDGRGFGKGGLVAILKGSPELTAENIGYM